MKLWKDSDQDGDAANTATLVWGESSNDEVQAVALSDNGKLLALILSNRCLFKSIPDGAPLGEISLMGSSLCEEDPSVGPHLTGGMFLQDDKDSARSFAVWSTNGAAKVYMILVSDATFKLEPMCEIPVMPYLLGAKSPVRFCQSSRRMVRVGSICSSVGDSSLWEPHVTMWSVPQFNSSMDIVPTGCCSSTLLGEGCFPGGPIRKWSSSHENKDNGHESEERIVSSSMVLSEDFYAPYAVVYGFYNGGIEVVRFVNLFPEVNPAPGHLQHHVNPHVSEQFFLGHMDAVLCLAAHYMTVRSGQQSFHRALVSGSMDCTVRIWDLDSGDLLSVMHHHVAPVRQIILPPPWTNRPWNDCFLSVGEDCCVALVSLETLRVERMFPGHPSYPSMVAWDSTRGYVACLCRHSSSSTDSVTVLYLWDVKTGARERIIRGTAAHSMFDHFCRGINKNSITGSILGGTTSASSLLLPVMEDATFSQSRATNIEKGIGMLPATSRSHRSSMDLSELNVSLAQSGKGKQPVLSTHHDGSSDLAGNSYARHASQQRVRQNKEHLVKCSCPFPGIASLKFDLSSLMSLHYMQHSDKQVNTHSSDHGTKELTFQRGNLDDNPDVQGTESHPIKESLEGCLLRFSLCFLHLWDIDHELDKLLMEEMNVYKPEGFYVASGLLGDRGSLTLMFPGLDVTLELWKSSSEFCAMRSLTIVSLCQQMISLSHSTTTASSALAAFYTRNFAEKVPDIKPPLLQLLVSFWQDPSEHVRMAARSLFHCSAPRAIPQHLCGHKTIQLEAPSSPIYVMEECVPSNTSNTSLSSSKDSDRPMEIINSAESEKSSIVAWLESFEIGEWISYIGGTSQDAVASHIIVAAALVVWYPSIVKDNLAMLVVDQLIKLVMSMNDRYSSTAAELLAEGMESTWKACIGPEIPRLVGDIFFQIECLSGSPVDNAIQNPTVSVNVREALVGILLPSLAMADITGFLNAIEGQIWATSSDSPVHLVSLKTLLRVVRGSPKPLAHYLDKVVNFVLQTMDPGNLVMRKACLNSSMVALREIARVFPMVALNDSSTRLAVGDAIGDIHNVTIRVYDIESVTKIKILDASGPLGLPSLLEGSSNTKIATAISTLSFSLDGEGLVAFSENGLMIRWWSLGTAWWEKLSRSLVPVQCTKLIFVPPWEGFSPNSSRTSIMASIIGHDQRVKSQDKTKELNDADSLKLLLHNLDLSYRLQWIGARNVLLTRHGQELGAFQL